jgi:branched-chain amino acid transport system ATP-binding protein
MMNCVLKLTNVSKSYGALKVTDDISFAIEAGETYGILGPNGAGKTTLFNLVSGDVRPDRGTIEFDGADVSALAPHRRCVAGIGRSYQVPRPFGGMTVFENLLVGATFGGALAEHEAYDVCMDILGRTGLRRRANQLASTLTLLDRKRLELARALATRPKVLLLDEIAGGLTEPETHELVDEIRRVKEQGVTIVWIEHVVHALLAVADRLLVIHFGRRLAEGKPAAVMEDPEVKRVYLGLEA